MRVTPGQVNDEKYQRCEEILEAMPKMFRFFLNECKGNIFNEKDMALISDNLRFIAQKGCDDQVKKTYVFLFCVYRHASGLRNGCASHYFTLSQNFYNLRPKPCREAWDMIEPAVAPRL